MHHPPFDCGIVHMDQIRLIEGAERLAEIVRKNGRVERILCGHHHRPIETLFGGTIASIAPGVTHQVAFDLRDDHEGALVLEPPAFRLHQYRPGTASCRTWSMSSVSPGRSRSCSTQLSGDEVGPISVETLFQDRKHLDFPPHQQWHDLLQNQGLEMRRLTMIEERLLVLALFVK